MTASDVPVGVGSTAPTGDPATSAQYLYTSHAHLELVCLAYKSGRNLAASLAAAQHHLDNYKDRP